jgi:hypothetical protein
MGVMIESDEWCSRGCMFCGKGLKQERVKNGFFFCNKLCEVVFAKKQERELKSVKPNRRRDHEVLDMDVRGYDLSPKAWTLAEL